MMVRRRKRHDGETRTFDAEQTTHLSRTNDRAIGARGGCAEELRNQSILMFCVGESYDAGRAIFQEKRFDREIDGLEKMAENIKKT